MISGDLGCVVVVEASRMLVVVTGTVVGGNVS
jgi:hypothetical protein